MMTSLKKRVARAVASAFASAFAIALLLCTPVAQAHFQLLLPLGHLSLQTPADQVLFMPFTHPAVSGHVMDIDTPEAFYWVHRGERTDLASALQPRRFQSAANTGKSFRASLSFRSLGDYVMVLQAAPYLEAEEGAYIQQITKTVMNVGGLPTDWDQPLALEAEIVPLSHPSALWVGSTFSFQVLFRGKPVPGAEIEVERINYALTPTGFAPDSSLVPPVPLLEVLRLRADPYGIVNFSLPKAGRWGFAALDLDGDTLEHKGLPLSLDAVIWVDAVAVP